MKKIFKKFLCVIILFISIMFFGYKNNVIELETEVDGKTVPCSSYGLSYYSLDYDNKQKEYSTFLDYKSGSNVNEPPKYDKYNKGVLRKFDNHAYWGVSVIKVKLGYGNRASTVLCEDVISSWGGSIKVNGKNYSFPGAITKFDITILLGGSDDYPNATSGEYEELDLCVYSERIAFGGGHESSMECADNISFDNLPPRAKEEMKPNVSNNILNISQTYVDKNLDTTIQPDVVVKKGDVTLTAGTDYSVSYNGTMNISVKNYDSNFDYNFYYAVVDRLGNKKDVHYPYPKFVVDETGETKQEEQPKAEYTDSSSASNGIDYVKDGKLADGFKFAIEKASIDCDEGTSMFEIIDEFWNIILIIAPILTIFMGTIEFVKVVLSSDADAMKKAGSNTVKRAIALFLLMIIKIILAIILKISGIPICF